MTDIPKMDIVEMLKSPANVFYEWAADNGDMLMQAAEEITALRAKVASLEAAIWASVGGVSAAQEVDHG